MRDKKTHKALHSCPQRKSPSPTHGPWKRVEVTHGKRNSIKAEDIAGNLTVTEAEGVHQLPPSNGMLIEMWEPKWRVNFSLFHKERKLEL